MTLPRLGDMNNSGTLTQVDAITISRIVEGKITENNFTDRDILSWANNWDDVLITADVNCDGKVDMDDVDLVFEAVIYDVIIPETCQECNTPTATFDIN